MKHMIHLLFLDINLILTVAMGFSHKTISAALAHLSYCQSVWLDKELQSTSGY